MTVFSGPVNGKQQQDPSKQAQPAKAQLNESQQYEIKERRQEQQLIKQETDAVNSARAMNSGKSNAIAPQLNASAENINGDNYINFAYLTTKKKAEKRYADPDIEFIRQQLVTVVSEGDLNKLDDAFNKVAVLKSGLDSNLLISIQEKVLKLTDDRDLLSLVQSQLSGNSVDIPDDKLEEFNKVKFEIIRLYSEDQSMQSYNLQFLVYENELANLLRAYDGVNLLYSKDNESSTETANTAQLLRDYLISQYEVLGCSTESGSNRLDNIITNVINERNTLVRNLSEATNKDGLLKVILEIPESAVEQVSNLYASRNKGKSLETVIKESFSARDIKGYMALSKLSHDKTAINVGRFIQLFDSTPESINSFLDSLSQQERGQLIQRAFSDRNILAKYVHTYVDHGARNIRQPEDILKLKLKGDDLQIAIGLVRGDSVSTIAAQIHCAIHKGNGVSAATLLYFAKHNNLISAINAKYQELYNISLGQDRFNEQDRLSPEMLIAMNNAGQGDGLAVSVAAIRSYLGFGDGATKDPSRVWEVLAALSKEDRALLNKSFYNYLSADERKLIYVSECTLEQFLSLKLNVSDSELPNKLISGCELTAWDLLKHGLTSSKGVDETFIMRWVYPLLANPETGRKAFDDIVHGYEGMLSKAPERFREVYDRRLGESSTMEVKLPNNFVAWINSQVSTEIARQLSLALAKPHIIHNKAELEMVLSLDNSGGEYRERALALVKEINEAPQDKQAHLQKRLALALAQLQIERETDWQIREIYANFAAQATGTVVGAIVLVGTGGTAAPVAILIAGGAGFGSRAIAYTVVSGHSPDMAHIQEYALDGAFDALSVGVAKGATAVTRGIATSIGAEMASSRLVYLGKMGVAGSIGGGLYGLSMGTAKQIRYGQFDALELLKDSGKGALIGGISTVVVSSLPLKLQTRTGLSSSETKHSYLEGKTPLSEGEVVVNNTRYIQNGRNTAVTTPLKNQIVTVVGTDQYVITSTPRQIAVGIESASTLLFDNIPNNNSTLIDMPPSRSDPHLAPLPNIDIPRVNELAAERSNRSSDMFGKEDVKPPDVPPATPPPGSPYYDDNNRIIHSADSSKKDNTFQYYVTEYQTSEISTIIEIEQAPPIANEPDNLADADVNYPSITSKHTRKPIKIKNKVPNKEQKKIILPEVKGTKSQVKAKQSVIQSKPSHSGSGIHTTDAHSKLKKQVILRNSQPAQRENLKIDQSLKVPKLQSIAASTSISVADILAHLSNHSERNTNTHITANTRISSNINASNLASAVTSTNSTNESAATPITQPHVAAISDRTQVISDSKLSTDRQAPSNTSGSLPALSSIYSTPIPTIEMHIATDANMINLPSITTILDVTREDDSKKDFSNLTKVISAKNIYTETAGVPQSITSLSNEIPATKDEAAIDSKTLRPRAKNQKKRKTTSTPTSVVGQKQRKQISGLKPDEIKGDANKIKQILDNDTRYHELGKLYQETKERLKVIFSNILARGAIITPIERQLVHELQAKLIALESERQNRIATAIKEKATASKAQLPAKIVHAKVARDRKLPKHFKRNHNNKLSSTKKVG